jgi:hypothetical protein
MKQILRLHLTVRQLRRSRDLQFCLLKNPSHQWPLITLALPVAGALNMATNGWVCAMEDRCPWGHRFDKATQRQIRAVTENILKGAALGPLGNWRMAFTQYNAPS